MPEYFSPCQNCKPLYEFRICSGAKRLSPRLIFGFPTASKTYLGQGLETHTQIVTCLTVHPPEAFSRPWRWDLVCFDRRWRSLNWLIIVKLYQTLVRRPSPTSIYTLSLFHRQKLPQSLLRALTFHLYEPVDHGPLEFSWNKDLIV